MKLYTIAFTKKGAILQDKINISIYNNFCSDFEIKEFLSPRIFEEIQDVKKKQKASLDEFVGLAWDNADVILFIGATGIAVRGIAKYVAKKDKDPAVIVMDELGTFVIPLLSGHIGGANNFAKKISEDLASTLVLTTATDINNKLAIDTWAVENNMEVAYTEGIAPVASSILEDKSVLLLSDKNIAKELGSKYSKFNHINIENMSFEDLLNIIEENKDKVKVVVSCFNVPRYEKTLHIVPKKYFIGMGARRDKDSEEFLEFYDEILDKFNIHKKSIHSITSIDLKSDEVAFHKLFEREKEITNIDLIFKNAENLKAADAYVDKVFQPSKLVSSVTGVDNVCERSAVMSAFDFAVKNLKYKEKELENKKIIKVLLEKTKKNGMTMAIAYLEEKEI